MALQKCNQSPAEVKAELCGKINAEFGDNTWTNRHLLLLAEQVILPRTVPAPATAEQAALQDALMRPSSADMIRFYALLDADQRTTFTWATFHLTDPETAVTLFLATAGTEAVHSTEQFLKVQLAHKHRKTAAALREKQVALTGEAERLTAERAGYEARIAELTAELADASAKSERWERNCNQAQNHSARLQADLNEAVENQYKYERLQNILKEMLA